MDEKLLGENERPGRQEGYGHREIIEEMSDRVLPDDRVLKYG